MTKKQLSFDAFHCLFIKWQTWVQESGKDRPRSFDTWMADWLTWAGYSKEQAASIKKSDVHTYLAEQYPDVFAPDFDWKTYYSNMEQETADLLGTTVPELKRGQLTLVKK
jgi:hypothetical protein